KYIVFFFFFQAEDGIRDRTVTGVQTCALPISPRRFGHARRIPERRGAGERIPSRWSRIRPRWSRWPPRWRARTHRWSSLRDRWRSEERRVGKEWRSGLWPYE